MSIGIDTSSAVSNVGQSYKSAQRSVAKASSGGSSNGSASVKLNIGIALLKKSREINSTMASQLIDALPKE